MKTGIIGLSILFMQVIMPSVDNQFQYIFPNEQAISALINWQTKFGDSLRWSQIDYQDDHWERNTGVGLWVNEGKPGKGIRWYRKRIFFPEPLDSLGSLALYQIATVSANEIYWDGQIIARNGQPSNAKQREITGVSARIFPIPRSLTSPGSHVLAMRVSNYHGFSGLLETPLQIGYLSRIHEHLFRIQALSIFLAGIFFLTALFHFAILLGQGNKWPYALFSAFCLSAATYIFIRGLLRYFQIDLIHYYTLAALNDIPWFLMMILLPIFFLFEFNSPFKYRTSIIISTIAVIIVVFPRLITVGLVPISWLNIFIRANIYHVFFTIAISIMVALWALYHRKRGSLSATIGLIIFLIGVIFSNRADIENAWAIGFTVLNVFLTISLSHQMAHRNRILQETELRSARLELELIKKHIQPHFLLNSLNSIVAWLEEDPPTAATLVNSFAKELRLLLTFSGKKMVLLLEEIELCKTHLRVMSLRQEKQYSLSVSGLKGQETLPPLILHTLIENGITHGYKGKDIGRFELSIENHKNSLKLELFNDSTITVNRVEMKEGTGLQYVRKRLEETYANMWLLSSGPVKGGWKVIIEIERTNL